MQKAYRKKTREEKKDIAFTIFVIFLIETIIINTFRINDDLQAKY